MASVPRTEMPGRASAQERIRCGEISFLSAVPRLHGRSLVPAAAFPGKRRPLKAALRPRSPSPGRGGGAAAWREGGGCRAVPGGGRAAVPGRCRLGGAAGPERCPGQQQRCRLVGAAGPEQCTGHEERGSRDPYRPHRGAIGRALMYKVCCERIGWAGLAAAPPPHGRHVVWWRGGGPGVAVRRAEGESGGAGAAGAAQGRCAGEKRRRGRPGSLLRREWRMP